MLSFQDFFAVCAGFWTTERTYHSLPSGAVERSYTEFQVDPLKPAEKAQIYALVGAETKLAAQDDTSTTAWPGFAIAFETRSETGEEVSMRLRALFVPDQDLPETGVVALPELPLAARVVAEPGGEVIQGVYLRDQGYSESGEIAGRFTYQPTRQTLEMTTFYRRSVAVDQMRIIAPDVRLRTIVTYQRPPEPELPPSVITLTGFGLERKRNA